MECTYRPTKDEEELLVRIATLDGLRAHGDGLPPSVTSSTVARVFRAGLEALELAEGKYLSGELLLAVLRGPNGEELASYGVSTMEAAERVWEGRGAGHRSATLDVFRLEGEPLRPVRLTRFGPGSPLR